jgi:hypothetical protein
MPMPINILMPALSPTMEVGNLAKSNAECPGDRQLRGLQDYPGHVGEP